MPRSPLPPSQLTFIKDGLNQSSKLTGTDIENTYRALETKLEAPSTRYKILYWKPTTDSIRQLSHDVKKIISDIPLLPAYTGSENAQNLNQIRQHWIDSLFRQNDSRLTSLVIEKIKNDILLTEYNLINYCDKYITYYSDLVFERFDAIITSDTRSPRLQCTKNKRPRAQTRGRILR